MRYSSGFRDGNLADDKFVLPAKSARTHEPNEEYTIFSYNHFIHSSMFFIKNKQLFQGSLISILSIHVSSIVTLRINFSILHICT